MFYDEFDFSGIKEMEDESVSVETQWKMAEILPFKLEDQFIY